MQNNAISTNGETDETVKDDDDDHKTVKDDVDDHKTVKGDDDDDHDHKTRLSPGQAGTQLSSAVTYSNWEIQLRIYKYRNTNTEIQIQKYKYRNTNTFRCKQIQKCWYNYNSRNTYKNTNNK